jgi:hypothetical protein
MKRAVFLVIASLAVACSEADPDEALLRRVDAAEARMLDRLAAGEQVGQSDDMDQDVTLLLRDYATYANAHHGDSLATRMLMKRAELLLGKGKADAAAEQWLNIVESGGSAAFVPEAMFRLGFIRETALVDTVGALKAYAQVVQLYPESSWSQMAADASKWLTCSEGEFIRALQQEGEGSRVE